jgi:hypothetical protein
MSRSNLATSGDTILRRLKHAAREQSDMEVPVTGIDEWAWSKGQSFGTILLDLERRRVVEVLAESSTDGLAPWLTAHPGITIISRDRHGHYAEGLGGQLLTPLRWRIAFTWFGPPASRVKRTRGASEGPPSFLAQPDHVAGEAGGSGQDEGDPSALMGVERHRETDEQQRQTRGNRIRDQTYAMAY